MCVCVCVCIHAYIYIYECVYRVWKHIGGVNPVRLG